jgi:hypothetical protein
MKSARKSFVLLFLGSLLFTFTSCPWDEKEEATPEPGPPSGIAGIWGRDDIDISFVGDYASFLAIYYGGWALARDGGFITLGDHKFESIRKVTDSTWIARELWYWEENGSTWKIGWSSECWLTMNKAGNKLHSIGNDPWDGHQEEHWYYKKVL